MKRKLLWNTMTPLLLQIITILSGFILPKLIISTYGSSTNGLIHSITQFLSIISFMDAGVGSVIRYNLYAPLTTQDNAQISRVMVSARRFYRRLAEILLIYVFLLVIFYPIIIGNQFDYQFTAFLILVMCISTFFQYFFGQVNQLLLTADQKGYIQYTAQICTVIANTIMSVVLIKMGAGIHAVKLITSLIYLIRPLFLFEYVKRHYSINYDIKITGEPIKQKWNGLAQHISSVVLDQTDIIVLTLFSTFTNVSIYSVYQMVVMGVKTLLTSMTSGVEAYLGKVIAIGNEKELDNIFSIVEWVIHTISIFVFGCTAMLIVPFVGVYTSGIDDANYYVPVFALLITLANAGHCLRLPYSITILSAGHYKQTQNSYIFAAFLNITVSVILVIHWGLIGVAIGTLCAMLFQTVWMANYSYKNILKRKRLCFIKQVLVDILTVLCIMLLAGHMTLTRLTYTAWILLAIKQATLIAVIIVLMNLLMYKAKIKNIIILFRGKG